MDQRSIQNANTCYLQATHNYDTDGPLHYVAHVTIDTLRGFHHISTTQGLFTKEGRFSWLDI